MRDYSIELSKRVEFIKEVLEASKAEGIVYGNSGGKDSALVGILCKRACDCVTSVMMPCQSKRNFEEDVEDALAVAKQFDIEVIKVDLSQVKTVLCTEIEQEKTLIDMAKANIAPRLRMTTVYAIAQSNNYLVAGTGNASEAYMGYFTKWGDGAYDFNPIADLTVTEIYEFLRFLGAPLSIIEKAPSAGLFEGQTDEAEMGLTYEELDNYILGNKGSNEVIDKIELAHTKSEHKRRLALTYGGK